MGISSIASNQIPFLDLVTPHVSLERDLVGVFQDALLSGGFVGGPMVERFESAFARFCETTHSVAVGSGTDALRFAILACGVERGDVVVTVPHTFIATTEAITQAGGVPEFIDIDEGTYNMSAARLQEYLETQCRSDASGGLVSLRSGRRVRAVIPVHIYGQMAEMDTILELADRYGLTVIEDACQAHGAEYFSMKHNRWMKAGSMGHAAAFSFYPGKNLGACGEAGAVTTQDWVVARKVRMLRDHGQVKKYYHEVEGYNGRMDAIQAGILSAKLGHLTEWNAQRHAHAEEYNRLLAENRAITLPSEPAWSNAVYHLYVIRVDDRDGLISHLKSAGIGSGIHYPIPLHMQGAYAWLKYAPGDFPVSQRVSAEILSLPMFPQLTANQQATIAEQILAFTSQSSYKSAVSEHIAIEKTHVSV